MTLQLRGYQADSRDGVRAALKSHRRVVLQSPTGSGKSVLIAHMIGESARRGLSSWLICHRRELIEQLSGTLWTAGVTHGIIAAGRSLTDDRVQVASVQTLVRRLDRLRAPNLLAVDECHHATATTYRKVMDHCSKSWVIGLTATPCRTDGRGLDDLFDALVLGPEVADLIAAGHLSDYAIYAPSPSMDLSGVHTRAGDWDKAELEAIVDQGAVHGDAVEHYQRLLPRGATCLVYCVSRKHARHVEAAYRAAGVDARYCGGDTPDLERREIINGLRVGSPAVVVSVDLFGEGLDAPNLRAVQLLRPTQSLGLHLQQLGRVLRPEPGKDRAIILDHVGNVLRHGLPDDKREWTLKGRKRSKSDPGAAVSLRTCSKCFAIYKAHLPACPLCQEEAPASQKRDLPDSVDGHLEELDRDALRRANRSEEARARTLEQLVAIALMRGYKPSWAGIKYAARTKGDRVACIREANCIARQGEVKVTEDAMNV